MDNAARKSARRVRDAGRRSAEHVEIEARAVARKIAHHGFDNFMLTMRERGVALDPAFGRRIFDEEARP